MIKTNPNSRFALYSLSQIRDSKEIILQTEKTESTFSNTKETCYLCEVVSNFNYSRNTVECLVAENIRLIARCEKMQNQIDKLNKKLSERD